MGDGKKNLAKVSAKSSRELDELKVLFQRTRLHTKQREGGKSRLKKRVAKKKVREMRTFKQVQDVSREELDSEPWRQQRHKIARNRESGTSGATC
eukprot:765096-Hanusia_phi.AAC.5